MPSSSSSKQPAAQHDSTAYAAFDDQQALAGNDHAVPPPAPSATPSHRDNRNRITTPQHEQLQNNNQNKTTKPLNIQQQQPQRGSASASGGTASSMPHLESSDDIDMRSIHTADTSLSNFSTHYGLAHDTGTVRSTYGSGIASLHKSGSDGGLLLRTRSSFGGTDTVPGMQQRFLQAVCPSHKIIVPRWVRHKRFQQGLALAAIVALSVLGIASYSNSIPRLRVAMIGNSMMYYNDFPRFLEALSDHQIEQDSCLHGDATLHSILITGSGTYKVWRTGVAQIRNASVELYGLEDDNDQDEHNDNNNNNPNYDFTRLYDYGACTVPQLLFGYDHTLDEKMADWSFEKSYESHGDDYFDDDDYYTLDNDDEIYAYDFDTFMDGTNPCLMDPNYYKYRRYLYMGGANSGNNGNQDDDEFYHNQYPAAPKWDYIILNDNTRSPAQGQSRRDTLSILEQQYLLWFQETGSTPVLMMTYAYDTPYRDMTGVLDIPTFTSLTYEGYRQYAELLSQRLPENQQPKIAPVGLAFLTVWEESYDFWNKKMFHIDRIHASPHGTYLQGCVVYCTLYGKLPPSKTALDQLSSLWNDARRMGPVRHRRLPLPTREEATYLHHVAERVCLQGHVPKSFVFYENGESTNYIPTDDTYKNDDIY